MGALHAGIENRNGRQGAPRVHIPSLRRIDIGIGRRRDCPWAAGPFIVINLLSRAVQTILFRKIIDAQTGRGTRVDALVRNDHQTQVVWLRVADIGITLVRRHGRRDRATASVDDNCANSPEASDRRSSSLPVGFGDGACRRSRLEGDDDLVRNILRYVGHRRLRLGGK